jgi:hypothetical protein
MKLSQRSIQRLGTHITGDNKIAPYRSGTVLVRFFNEYGCNYLYGKDFGSRWQFAEKCLVELNGSNEMFRLVEAVFNPLAFKALQYRDAEFDLQRAIDDINPFFQRDGYRIACTHDDAKVLSTNGTSIGITAPQAASHAASNEFIKENLDKCQSKLRERDYAGAITNARSLSEEVLCEIEKQLDASPPRFDGDLAKLYKRVRKLLNLDPETYAEREDVMQMLRGFVAIVDGLASMSNQLGDRHGGRVTQPKPHHAHLAVNAANTLCTFILESFLLQQATQIPETS